MHHLGTLVAKTHQ